MPRLASLLGAGAGLAPDLDIFIPTFGDATAAWFWHRGPSHSLLAVPIGALLCWLVFLVIPQVRKQKWISFLACLIGFATHAPLDALTTYGTMLFWPITTWRVALDWMPIIDPIWTLTLLGGVIVATKRKSPSVSQAALAFGLAYFAFAAIQHHRALDATIAVARARGHEPLRARAMPSPLAPLVWRGLYEHDGAAWALGVRTRYIGPTTVKPGESRPLAIRAHVATSPESKRQFNRFDWFTDGYSVVDNSATPLAITDGRYSMDPARFASLWGVDFSTDPPRRFRPPRSLERSAIIQTMLGRDPAYEPLE